MTDQSIEGDAIQHFFARRMLRLESRVQGLQAKLGSLGKVVRLLQHYTEKKDQQYQKETSNLHLFHSQMQKMEQLQAQLTQAVQKCEDISGQQCSIRLDQLARNMQERQETCRSVEQRLTYDLQETTQKMERLEMCFLQQLREQGKRHTEALNKVLAHFNLQEINFKIAQIEQSQRADYEKIKNKLERMAKKAREEEYGLVRPQSRQKSTQSKNSLLKRVKSK